MFESQYWIEPKLAVCSAVLPRYGAARAAWAVGWVALAWQDTSQAEMAPPQLAAIPRAMAWADPPILPYEVLPLLLVW